MLRFTAGPPVSGRGPRLALLSPSGPATYCKARIDHQVASQAVVVAIGVHADGHREALGVDVGDTEHGTRNREQGKGNRRTARSGPPSCAPSRPAASRSQARHRRRPPRPRAGRAGGVPGRRDPELPGALHAQRLRRGAQAERGDGRRPDPHHLAQPDADAVRDQLSSGAHLAPVVLALAAVRVRRASIGLALLAPYRPSLEAQPVRLNPVTLSTSS